MYLTYDEYVNLGGTVSETEFTLLEFKARKRIDRLTDCRVSKMSEVPEAVKPCMMSLIRLENKVGVEAQVETPVVTSFNTDGYSESYGNVLNTEDAQKSMNSVIQSYLYGETDDNGLPLLYRGVHVPPFFDGEGGD